MSNNDNLTYRELKNLVPEAPRCKMTAKKLEGEEIFISKCVEDAEIKVYKNGFLTYTKQDDHGNPHSTVYSVHRCSKIIFKVSFSKEERDDGWDCSGLADSVTYRMIDDQLVKFHIVNEEHYLDDPWWMPICIVCEERMQHNQSSREEYRSEFSLDGGTEEDEDDCENWNSALSCSDNCEEWLEQQAQEEEKVENHKRLMEGMRSITDIQRQVLDLYYSNQGITERDIARELNVNQSTVHRNLQAGLKNLRKFF